MKGGGPMRQKIKVILTGGIGALLLFVIALAEQKPRWKGSITKEGDVIVVKNPKEPLYKENILAFKEELSIGGAEAQGNNAFSQIRTFAIDDAENVYVLDSKEAHIKIFDKNGKYIRTFGRSGQGPGELELPQSISINKTTKEIIVQEISRRLSIFALDGKFLRNLSLKETWGLRVRTDSRGYIYVTEGVVDPKGSQYLFKKFGPDMKLIAILSKTPAPTPVALNPFMAIAYWEIDQDDKIVYGYPEDYEIQVFNLQNKLIKRISRKYDPVEVTEDEKKEQTKDTPPGINIKFDFPKYHSAYRRFFLDDQNRIFVQSWEKTEGGKKFLYDIFDEEGKFLARVPLKLTPVILKKGKLYSLEEDDEGYQTVKRYAVTWLK